MSKQGLFWRKVHCWKPSGCCCTTGEPHDWLRVLNIMIWCVAKELLVAVGLSTWLEASKEDPAARFRGDEPGLKTWTVDL